MLEPLIASPMSHVFIIAAVCHSKHYCSMIMTFAHFGVSRLNLMRKNCVVKSLMPLRTSMEFGIFCTVLILQ